MSRSSRSPVVLLAQEVRAIELLADETEVEPSDLQEYWDLSARLINLSADIDEFAITHPRAAEDDPAMLDFRHRLRNIAARLTEIASD